MHYNAKLMWRTEEFSVKTHGVAAGAANRGGVGTKEAERIRPRGG